MTSNIVFVIIRGNTVSYTDLLASICIQFDRLMTNVLPHLCLKYTVLDLKSRWRKKKLMLYCVMGIVVSDLEKEYQLEMNTFSIKAV